MIAMMTNPDINNNSISIQEIKEYFFKSWIFAYKHMFWQLNKVKAEYTQRNIIVPNLKQIEKWAATFESKLKSSIEDDLKESGINVNMAISFEEFNRWIHKDHTIYMKFDNKTSKIATSLNILDEVGFDNGGYVDYGRNQGGMQGMQGQNNANNMNKMNNANNLSYPGFEII